MRLLQHILFFCSVIAPAHSLSLANFEELVQIPQDCNAAWTAAIPDCDRSDFLAGGSCSSKCVASLRDVAKAVSYSCQGVSVDPNTLMGLFFKGQGLNAICPNLIVTSVVGGGSGNGGATTAKGTISVSSTAAAPSLPIVSTEIVYDTSALLATKSTLSRTTTSVPPSSVASSTPSTPASIKATSTSLSISPLVTATTLVTTTVLTKTSLTTLTKSSSTTSAATSTAVSTATVTSTAPAAPVTNSLSKSAGTHTDLILTSSSSALPLPTVISSTSGNRNAQTHEANPSITGGGGSPFEISNHAVAKYVSWRVPCAISMSLLFWFWI